MKEYPVLRGRVQYDERIPRTPGEGFSMMREYPRGRVLYDERIPRTKGKGSV